MAHSLQLTNEHLRRFAEASGDLNPLHSDETYARATPYGRCIAQGALVTIAALGALEEARLRHTRTIAAQFKQPVFPGEEQTVSLVGDEAGTAKIEVARGGRVAVAVTVATDLDAPLPEVERQAGPTLRSAPVVRTLSDLAEERLSLDEPYACDHDALYALAHELGAQIPRGILVWLAAASYAVGMLAPGRDALFVGARMARSSSERSDALSGAVTAFDDRTGLVNLDVEVEQSDASARMTLNTFLRPPVAPPDRSSIARYLTPSAELRGRNVLVVGGSRGLGAALSGAFATQEAVVWTAFARSGSHAEALRAEFGDERIRPLTFDAEAPEQVAAAIAALRDSAGTLEGIALCAAPPLFERGLDPGAGESILAFVRASLAMVLLPLARALPLLSPTGWIVVLSSGSLEEPPEGWPHYTVAKAAVEGLADYCRAHTSASVLVARPPTMLTDSMNTPLARLGAVATEQVAAAIVRWTMGDRGVTVLRAPELAEATPERPRPGAR